MLRCRRVRPGQWALVPSWFAHSLDTPASSATRALVVPLGLHLNLSPAVPQTPRRCPIETTLGIFGSASAELKGPNTALPSFT
jgi:hypothetical protein